MKSIYPDYPTQHKKVTETGGYHRTCLVVELLSLQKASDVELSLIQERLEAYLSSLLRNVANLEKSQVVLPNRFTEILQSALRI